MPKGVYERKPWMASRSRRNILTPEQRAGIIRDKSRLGTRPTARKWGVSPRTVNHLDGRDWNPHRRHSPPREGE